MITRTLQKLLKSEATGGILLLIAAAAAMIIANSSLHDWYHHFWHSDFTVGNMQESLHFWVNDALMVIFFFVVGLEIKREIMSGELSSVRQAMLPVVAAVGGMVVPIIIYLIMNGGNLETMGGWGIPMATDIAFAIGILSLLGSRAPLSLKVFLTAFAIVDDMGAVIVIAIFYSEKIGWLALGVAAALLLLLYILGQKGVHNKLLTIVIGIIVWWLFLKSGVHTTIAGVLLALTLPLKAKLTSGQFSEKIENEVEKLKNSVEKKQEAWSHHQLEMIDKVKSYANNVTNPLQWFENNLHRFTMLVIMPIFAFANAGVYLGDVQGGIFEGVSLSIILGLVLGKLVGVFSFSWISVKMKLASLPSNSRWKDMVGIAMLGGVGFTMSLFIANLSFEENVAILDKAKIGILAASATAAVLGMLYLVIVLPKKEKS
ncbi:MAG: Na+/H+ antiporter NhaA [Bacteroidales bacterium]|nr:Na+/H+ antiporter NhaA [Bacteroidales bacterium]